MRQRKGERASERHQSKIDVGTTEACRFYEIWIVPHHIKSVGGSSPYWFDPHSIRCTTSPTTNVSVRSIGVKPACSVLDVGI